MGYDPKAPDWNVMTRTRGGTVSLLKNLSEDEARACMQRLRRPFDRGDPWSERAIKEDAYRKAEAEDFARQNPPKNGCQQLYSWSTGGRVCSDGDLEQIDCWGPPGATLEVWPKPADYEARFRAALKVERAAVKARSLRAVEVPPAKNPATKKASEKNRAAIAQASKRGGWLTRVAAALQSGEG